MAKKIFKEIGIVLLLLVAIALMFAIVFYDYISDNKTVPIEIQAYSVPEDIEQELEQATSGEQNIVRTYYIDSSDLNLYESTNDYDKGKSNPFAYYSEGTTTSTNSANNDENTNTVENDSQDVIDSNEVYINTPGKNY